MIRIAIVEDEKQASDLLGGYVERYFGNSGGDYRLTVFDNALKFLDGYKADHDIVFMDIEMPDLDGMKAAEQLRTVDQSVIIVFVTNMQQYAVKGYAVGALDFIVKPVEYFSFSTLMDKAGRVLASRAGKEIAVKSDSGMRRVSVSRIRYIEVRRHRLTFHTEDGDFEAWGNLRDIEAELPPDLFSRCNIGYLVSLPHVAGVEGEEVVIWRERLKISRPRRKEFLADLARHFGSVR